MSHNVPSSGLSKHLDPTNRNPPPPEVSTSERDRLRSDLGTFSAAGVERAAWGWDQHAGDREEFRNAERAALHGIEKANRGAEWDEFRRSLFEMTEGRSSLVAWRYEHGETGHKAERAAYGAALALFARGHISRDQFETLARPMDEALPWLLPKEPPHARDASSVPGKPPRRPG